MKKSTPSFLEIASTADFDREVVATFQHQYNNNMVYRSYCDLINIAPNDVQRAQDVPYLPTRFFKSHTIQSFEGKPVKTFTSSGTTTSINAQHHLADLSNYRASFQACFEQFYGKPKDWAILALLPSYLEREGSSLIYMMDSLIAQSKNEHSGFYLDDLAKLNAILLELEQQKQPTLLLGVSFALLDFTEQYSLNLSSTTVMDTGGIKGRRKELTREELHKTLQKGFGVSAIHSEYGMTELLSQAYAKGDGRFHCPNWMRVTPFEINDPFAPTEEGKIGRLNIIDLANQESCAFIATDDLGRSFPDGTFEVMGRLDASDIRGCNLLVY